MLLAPALDDLTWEDLRQLAQRRIPAASNGEWTHHAPVDPGITLLELFAFLLEQQVYVLDQVPDFLIHGILRLLGEEVRPTQTARTVLAGTIESSDKFGLLRRDTVVRTIAAGLEPLQFTLNSDASVLPISSVSVIVGGMEVVPGAISGPVRLMASDWRPSEFDIVLRFDAPAPANPGPLSLLIDLDVAQSIAPAWSAIAVDVPPAAPLRFAQASGTTAVALPPDSIHDGTDGLRRAGVLSLDWQPQWDGAAEIRLRISTNSAAFAEPPILRRIVPNAVMAEHRVRLVIDGRASDGSGMDPVRARISDQLDRWLPLSDLTFDLPDELTPPLEGSVKLSLSRNGSPSKWEATDDLGFAGSADQLFVIDRPAGKLRFGNGYSGRVPAPADDFSIELQIGGGTEGNLPQGLSWEVVDPPAGACAINLANVVPAAGGTAAETAADARERVTGDLRQLGRVVTAEDIRTLLETMPGVVEHRAWVVPGYDPDFPCIRVPDSVAVFIVPRVRRNDEADRALVPAPRADPGAIALFESALEQSRMLATCIHVVDPKYHMVALTVTGRGSPDALVEQSVHEALAQHLDAVAGGDDRAGWPFGRPLRPSELVRVAQAAADEAWLIEHVAVEIDHDGKVDDCGDTRIGPNDLVYLESCKIVLLPPENAA